MLCSRCSREWEGTWAVSGGEERGMLDEGVEMAPVVFLLGRESSASAAWGDFNTTQQTGSSFHSCQWPLSWLGAVSLCLSRQQVRCSSKKSMAGKS